MPEFNTWFPDSQHGTNALNVKNFGAIGDGFGHPLGSGGSAALNFATLSDAQNGVGGNGVAYPSATDLSDYADWAAITECFKQAFYHEDPPGTWVPNGTSSYLNKPVFFPGGRYVINKSLWLVSVAGANIFGHNGVNIYNEIGGTAPDNSCILTNGFQYSNIEGITFGTVGGLNSKAFDINHQIGGGTNNTNALTFRNCHFSAPGGHGVAMADAGAWAGAGDMCSEISFYHCSMNNCANGIYIGGWNALNYSFISCGGTFNDIWLNVSIGGDVCVKNGSLTANGLDISIGADAATVISTRTESKKFITANGPVTVLGCVQACEGNDCTFVEVGAGSSVFMQGCKTTMGRLHGEGQVTMDGCQFNLPMYFKVLTVTASPTSPLIRVTHQDSSAYTDPRWVELWLDGDQITIGDVTGTGAASINGTWNITKINHNTVDLRGSTFGGTYTALGMGGAAHIGTGPRYHLVDPDTPSNPPKLQVSAMGSRPVHATKTKDFQLMWVDSGTVFDNLDATGEVVFTLPNLGATDWFTMKGTKFTFIVLTAQSIKIQVVSGTTVVPTRIFRAGGYATAGTNVSSNVVGNSIEIYQPDSPNATVTDAGHRWLVRTESGTWTIAGTPS